jgi:SET domain-containing protein
MNLFPCVEVRQSHLGYGIFAIEAVPRGTLLLQFEGEYLTFDEQCQLDHEGNALQIGQNLYINPKPPGLYTNHSCDPNCYINSGLWLVAARHIDADEELTIDYSTTMLERHWEMHDCQCGSSLCRGTIRDFDTLPAETQVRHVEQGWAMQHVLAASAKSLSR